MSFYRVRFICCGREDGCQEFATYEEARSLREAYISGTSGHDRVAIIEDSDTLRIGWQPSRAAAKGDTNG